MNAAYKQPWIGKPLTDIVFILLPPFLSLGVIICFPSWFRDTEELPDFAWVTLILLIDVAHVYSTLYRTYFDKQALSTRRYLLWNVPLIGFLAGVLIYSLDSVFFWRILAYVAVFHFVRQQYGFMRLYSRKEPKGFSSLIDKVTIYYATLYPLLYWHLKGQRNFNWFMEGDFLYFESSLLLNITTLIYFLLLITFLVKEVYLFFKNRYLNLPRLAVILGTVLSWYFGIVYFNGDMAFTLLNVVSHGIPYMALIWIYGKKQQSKSVRSDPFLGKVFSRYGLVIFLTIVFLFAFIEEGLWDLTVWQERHHLFGTAIFGRFELSHQVLSFIVPLLALPQITHYILDGFIWKMKKNEMNNRKDE